VYVSGQIPLDPATGELVGGDMEAQVRRVFENLQAIAVAAGGDLDSAAKLNVYLTDLGNFQLVNRVMAEYVPQPYPARAAVGVAALPRGASVEIDCVLEL
jgi:reactive intermediate/imine deaminase